MYFKNQGMFADTKSKITIGSRTNSKTYMKFEKESENVFNLQVSYPFSIFQAYAIVCTVFN